MYRTRNYLTEQYSISESTVDRLISFIKKNPARYPKDSILYLGRAVRVDERAFKDAVQYRDLISIGLAPKYRRKGGIT